jgi:tetratricopeptide (TPR) repeat protein
MLYNYACLHECLNNLSTAKTFFNFALEVIPDWSDALYGKSLIYFKLGKLKLAKENIKKAIKEHQDFKIIEELKIENGLIDKNEKDEEV